ncbi:MAG: D-xylose transport system substrate-binding protein [Solirubrobacteraceae bacterium]|jgi:D-xylose transport system substrate-binding protein|nr:D-xylose transport system substrate-binding protein [Solirubrobacteraceae bacterium]
MAISITRAGAAGLAAAALALGAAACGGSDNGSGSSSSSGSGGASASGKGAKIALLLPESKTTRYEQQDKPNFERRVKELCPDCQVIYANADQDAAKQQQQAEQAITNGAKAMVLDAVDVKSAAAIVTRAKQAKIPVVSYGRLVSNADLDYYVSIDPKKVGEQQGTALLDALKKQGKQKGPVVMINGSPTDSNAAPYKQGAHSVLDAAGVKVAKEYDTPDWSPDKAQTEMEQAITGVGKTGFAGVYVANDGMAGGAISAMKGAGIQPASRPVTGQDAEVAGLQRILAGDQLMTVYQPIKQLAAKAAELAVPLAQGKPVPAIAKSKVNNGEKDVASVLIDTQAVDKKNMNDTVIADGFVTPAQLCTGQYAKACKEAGIS